MHLQYYGISLFLTCFCHFLGALLFGNLNNRLNQRAYNRLGRPPPSFRAPPPPVHSQQRFRKRRLPLRQQRRPNVGGRRRLRKKGTGPRDFAYRHRAERPVGLTRRPLDYGINQRYEVSDPLQPMTRDKSPVKLEEEMYAPEASVLEPVKPMLYDPYMYEDQNLGPIQSDDYYYDYYDSLPDFSALKAPKNSKMAFERTPTHQKNQMKVSKIILF
jgi:hypothetical protein